MQRALDKANGAWGSSAEKKKRKQVIKLGSANNRKVAGRNCQESGNLQKKSKSRLRI